MDRAALDGGTGSSESTATAQVDLAPVNSLRFDEYTIVGKIGQGGMSEVHLALAEGPSGFRKLVVLKRLFPHLNEDDGVVRMFLDEARLAARLSHPHIVQTLKVGAFRGQHFIAMEFLSGQPLHRLIHRANKKERRVPPPLLARIIADSLEGLHHAHEAQDFDGTPLGVVHRDVSPHNIFVTYDGVTKLLDFGIAKAATQEAATRTGLVKGKFAYISPEQARGQPIDRRADLWSAGVVVWEALTGSRLFKGETEAVTLENALTMEIPDPRTRVPGVAAPIADMVRRALQRDPDGRPRTAREMKEVLEGWLVDQGLGDGRTALRAYMQEEFGALEREQRALVKQCVAQVEARRSSSPGELASPGTIDLGQEPSVSFGGSRSGGEALPSVTSAGAADGGGRLSGAPSSWGLRAAVIGGVVALAALLAFLIPRPEGESPEAETGASQAASAGTVPGGSETSDDDLRAQATELRPTDRRPEKLAGVLPIAPSEMALTPTVTCRLLIDADGQVRDAQIYRHRPELAAFERAALRAVQNFQFEPAERDGAPIPVWVNWPVRFIEAGARPLQLQIKGSDTIGGALGPALAQTFMEQHADIAISVEALGSSTGFGGLFDGTADLAASSRPVKADELKEARELGIRLREFVIGYDGIAIIVHPDNPVRELTLGEASRLFTGEVRRWSALGGDDEAVRLLSRPSYSGTHAFFKEKVLRGGARRGSEEFAPDTEFLERSEAIADVVAADPTAVGYVGFGWATGRDDLATVAIAAGPDSAPVMPSIESIRTSDYPVARPLMFYSRGMPTGAVASFLRFVFSPGGQAIVADHGFSPADAPVEIASGDDGAETPSSSGAGGGAPELHRIYFGRGGDVLDEAARQELASVARAVLNGDQRALILGHSDAEGEKEANRELARSRARRVSERLRELGVPESRIEVRAIAQDQPIASNETIAGRRANRRVDVFLIDR